MDTNNLCGLRGSDGGKTVHPRVQARLYWRGKVRASGADMSGEPSSTALVQKAVPESRSRPARLSRHATSHDRDPAPCGEATIPDPGRQSPCLATDNGWIPPKPRGEASPRRPGTLDAAPQWQRRHEAPPGTAFAFPLLTTRLKAIRPPETAARILPRRRDGSVWTKNRRPGYRRIRQIDTRFPFATSSIMLTMQAKNVDAVCSASPAIEIARS